MEVPLSKVTVTNSGRSPLADPSPDGLSRIPHPRPDVEVRGVLEESNLRVPGWRPPRSRAKAHEFGHRSGSLPRSFVQNPIDGDRSVQFGFDGDYDLRAVFEPEGVGDGVGKAVFSEEVSFGDVDDRPLAIELHTQRSDQGVERCRRAQRLRKQRDHERLGRRGRDRERRRNVKRELLHERVLLPPQRALAHRRVACSDSPTNPRKQREHHRLGP